MGAAFAIAAVLAVSGCVYKNTQIADPGVFPFGDKYLIASTGSGPAGTGSVLPIYEMSKSGLQNRSSSATFVGQVFKSGQLPSWIYGQNGVWAPEIKLVAGHLIAYYSAEDKQLKPYYDQKRVLHYHRCIGMAIAQNGISKAAVFTPAGKPFCNPQDQYDLIDPTVFTDGNQNYLLFKRDPAAPDTKLIAIAKLSADGLTPSLPTTQIATPTQTWEKTGWQSVEAPTMIRRGAFYYLFYSGNFFKSGRYGVGVARCRISTVGGDPTKCNFDLANSYGWKDPNNPILTALGSSSYCGAGHQDVTDNGALLWYHTYTDPNCAGTRSLGLTTLEWGNDGWPTADGGGAP